MPASVEKHDLWRVVAVRRTVDSLYLTRVFLALFSIVLAFVIWFADFKQHQHGKEAESSSHKKKDDAVPLDDESIEPLTKKSDE